MAKFEFPGYFDLIFGCLTLGGMPRIGRYP